MNHSLIAEENALVETWPLMGSPTPLMLTFASYLLFVLQVGPKYMSNRKPWNLSLYIRCYNVFQVLACTYFVSWSLRRGIDFSSTWKCIQNQNDPDARYDLNEKSWFFMWLRIAEFSETVVFVLRKKQNQVSPLHVYHHISTVVLLWMFLKYSPSEMGIYICTLNSFVHIIMYSYYFLSSFNEIRKNSLLLFIKPFITIIQLAQLGLILGHSIAALLPSCRLTKLFYMQVSNGAILIGFFLKFYIDSYVKNSIKKIK